MNPVFVPNSRNDLDKTSNNVVIFGDKLSTDHPGFNDEKYKIRRKEIATIAQNYIFGNKIPRIIYDSTENKTWESCLDKLLKLFPNNACKEYYESLNLLFDNNIYNLYEIPQLQTVSDFLENRTGWVLRPVKGLLSTRDFIAGFAFKVFYCTQYIRHSSKPDYTPEPDIIHELIGHVPMLFNKDFSEFTQTIGKLSLGACDDLILKIGRLYWYSIEFGLSLDNGIKKAFGAGILSSFGELEYSLSSTCQAKYVDFEPEIVCEIDYPITKFQEMYCIIKNFNEATQKIKNFIEIQKY